MQIEFRGYTGDCLITGILQLTAPRLTDMLNEQPVVQLRDVTLESLEDARRVTAASYGVRREELYAIRVTGPRGDKALRVLTIPHRVQAQIGPYNVLGRLNTPPGLPPSARLGEHGPMLPLTDATIAYVVGGILEVRDATTVIINRDLASWVRTADSSVAVGANATLQAAEARR